ncbi:hypothetical protein GE09DRAFT_1253710 [Coniochaeta sp. 2T2.1]|nr:hypothetical protein GE09DRAFT_1253710 [Coniochaeta sp. 2T2.1]
MVGSRDLPPSITSFGSVFYNNQFRAKPQWPAPRYKPAGIQLLDLGLSRLILAVRSVNKGENAAAVLRSKYHRATVDVWQLDMCSYDSIQTFARRVDSHLPRIDVVILNAGVIKLEFHSVQSTGHEETAQVNYLSTAFLALLLPILKNKRLTGGEPSHLSIVSAAVTLVAKFPNRDADPLLPSFDNPMYFDRQETYNTSKLMMHSFLWKLVGYVKAEDVIVNLTDPAWVKGTGFTRDVKGPIKVLLKLFSLTGRTPRIGAACLVDAVVNKGKESHGCFLMSWEIYPFSAILYTPEGNTITQRIWDETLAEFDFADVRGILNYMKA